MQSDVHHVLLPSENAAWHYTASTCANSPTVFPFFISVAFPSFPLLSPLCQGSAGPGWCGAALCWAHARQTWPYLVNHVTEWGERWDQSADEGEQILMRAEHTQTQEEGRGSTKEALRPDWFHDRWRLSRGRICLSQTEHRNALGESGCHRVDLEGGDAGWGWPPSWPCTKPSYDLGNDLH